MMSSVYSFGQGAFGQLGHGEESDQTKPKLIVELRSVKVVRVACGGRHSAAITDTGVLFTWGCNEDGGKDPHTILSVSSIISPTLTFVSFLLFSFTSSYLSLSFPPILLFMSTSFRRNLHTSLIPPPPAIYFHLNTILKKHIFQQVLFSILIR